MKKRVCCALLTLCLLLALLPAAAAAEDQGVIALTRDNYTNYFTRAQNGDTFLKTGSYILTEDIKFADGNLFRIGLNSANEGEHSTVTLDLNGHVLKQTTDFTPVIEVNGGSSLTILDSRPNVPHKFSVDQDTGRWRLDEDGRDKVVYGGIITRTGIGTALRICEFSSGQLSAICTMNGGNIVGASSTINCGGVFVQYHTEFIMNGGSIRGCTLTDTKYKGGGGVYVLGTFTMNGGTISDCKAGADGDALYVDPDGSFSMSANATISGSVDGAYTVTFESNGGSAVPSQVQIDHPAARPADPTKPGYTFAGWYKGDTKYDFSQNVTANLTLTAHWTSVPVTPVEEPTMPWWIILPALDQTVDFPFYDVDANDWFYEPVKSAWENELIDGVTARYFKPDSTLTVAQAIKLAAALHQKQSVGFVTLQNGGTHWYDNYVNYAVANGLIEAAYQSKSAETMNAPVTRAEFVHILAKLLNTGTINTVNSIPDVKAGDAYADEIFAFYRAGILTGSDRLGTFHPESSLKRSEAAAILVRLYDATQRQYITLR